MRAVGQRSWGKKWGVEVEWRAQLQKKFCIAGSYMLYVFFKFDIPLPLEVQFQTKKWIFSLGHVRRIPFLDVFQVILFNTMITHHLAPPFW